MGRVFLRELEGYSYNCSICNTPVALIQDLISRSYNWRQGRAYLFNNVVNITLGSEEDRRMRAGVHTVQDVFCCCCGRILGWKYVAAHDENQRYVEGKFILDRYKVKHGF